MRRVVIVSVLMCVMCLLPAPDAGADANERTTVIWSLARLLEGAEKPRAMEELSAGLAHPDPVVRGVAARVVHVINLQEATGAVMRALESETDASVARELMRTASSLDDAGSRDAIVACAERFGGNLHEPALLLQARFRGAESIPLYLEHEKRLSPGASFRVLSLATRGDRPAVEQVARQAIEQGRESVWSSALHLLSGKDTPPAPLLAEALRGDAAEIRKHTAARLILMAGKKKEVLTPEVLSALEPPAPGSDAVGPEEGFARELLRRMGGKEPDIREEWLEVLSQPGTCFLDVWGAQESVEIHLAGKERKAARRRWGDRGRYRMPVYPLGAGMPTDLPRTLGDLPAGFAQAVIERSGCLAPEQAVVWMAEVTYQTSGRPASVRTIKTPGQSECLRWLTLMLRANLTPDDVPIEPSASSTVLVPFAAGAVKRLDELPPADPPVLMDEGFEPPERVVFVKPYYPQELRQLRIEGKVILEMAVDRQGVPGNMRVLKLNRIELALSAIQAVSQWRYRPATRSGGPVPVMLTVIVDFDLRPR
ncbi:MAG: energy transducer TonB [Candidatus Polarisedimenticolia bacterium]